MSTLKTVNIQHPSASTPAITLDSAGAMTGSFPYPNRNLLYNGAMQIHQRSTSVASITVNTYNTADRWAIDMNAQGTWTNSIESDAPTGSGFSKSLKVLCTTAAALPSAGSWLSIRQTLEGQDLQRIAKGTASAQQLTLSFWVKSNVTGTYVVSFYDTDNSRNVTIPYSISQSATWEKKAITVPADQTGIFTNDNNGSLSIYFILGAGSTYTSGTAQTSWGAYVNSSWAVGINVNVASSINNYFQITGVQLETGAVATPFEFKSYGQELRECQRYYWRSTPSTSTDTIFGFGRSQNTTTVHCAIPLPVPMRTPPSSMESSTLSVHAPGISQTSATLTLNTSLSGAEVGGFVATASGLTAGTIYFITKHANSAGYIAFSAEL